MSEKTSAPQGARTATPLPVALQSVERAIADLRRGAIVLVAGNGHALIVQAAEGLTRDALSRMMALAKSPPSLLLTARRASVLGLTDHSKGAVRISLSSG
ncbi:MAG: GTP cyclohydrolase II, partial [Alphaproteobacteria bacterium]